MIRLLLVDDEPILLIPTKTFLERDNADIECDTANSAREALSMLAASPYDAIVSDYDMPEMDGIALLQEVRRQYGTLPFILFSGRGREAVVIEALNHGADFYVQRGPDPSSQYAELAHKVRRAVERKRAEDDLRETLLELQTTVEELKVAEEEVRSQNEELMAAREELHAEHQRYVDLFEYAPYGYILTDANGVIQEINHEGARKMNVNGKNLVGKPLVIFIAKDERVTLHTLIGTVNCGSAKELRDRRITLQPRDDSPFPISLDVGAVCDAGNNLIGLRWLIREITS
ncbi:MAG TPA: response regulator, partial [Methanoculleus sp.]|nr:response regulator [Methanoculleus sp.]